MRKFVVVLTTLSALYFSAQVTRGCGDKTMRVGGGLRYLQLKAKKNPSAILIHAIAFPDGKAARLHKFLNAVGHKATLFDNSVQISEVLKATHYDIILTDLGAAPELQNLVATVSPRTVVVPVTSKSNAAAAAKQYKVIVKNPEYAEDFLKPVSQVMKARAKKV